jgi:hypothetical protein
MRQRILRAVGILLGVLVLWIALMFLAGAVMQSRVPVNLAPFSSVTALSDGYVNATGTWVIEGDSQGFPLQTTELSCEREFKRCTSATAQVMMGTQMHVHLDTYQILNWEKTRVVFVDTAPSCVSYVYTIDLATKAVSGVRTRKPNATAVLGDCGAYDKELRLSLRGGLEVTKKLQDDALPWFGHLAFAPFKLLH